MSGQDILCRISKGTFEIPHKISCPYIERYDFNTVMKFEDLLDLKSSYAFLKCPSPHSHMQAHAHTHTSTSMR